MLQVIYMFHSVRSVAVVCSGTQSHTIAMSHANDALACACNIDCIPQGTILLALHNLVVDQAIIVVHVLTCTSHVLCDCD